MTEPTRPGGPLSDVRILDASNLIAGPLATMLLADLGAEVVKIEHPTAGDSLRNHGGQKDGQGLWWKELGRGKLCVTLDIGRPEGQDIFRQLASQADVVVENFRPGTMGKWGIDYAALQLVNPSLVMAHVTGFGQSGPLSSLPGFGTIAESMSGFAQRNGAAEGPPTLPPFGLADTVTGITTALAIMTALWERRASGAGQEIDVSIIEPLLTVLEPQIIEHDQLGRVAQRVGNRSTVNAPRNMYLSRDQRWLALSTSTQSTADRLILLIGRPDVAAQPWFSSAAERAAHADELDAIVGGWVAGRDHQQVLAECRSAGVPISTVYDVRDILADPQYAALGAIATVPDEDLGPLRMAATPFRLSRTPAQIRWAGPRLGAHNDLVYDRLGLTEADRRALRERGVI
jgi:crotonobetainyl-CoA:carnitine CoA-transferase CaiB-like acyl-CoA transferase